MPSLPSFICFINGDITYPAEPPPDPPTYIGAQYPQISELTHLQTQLFIDDTMTKDEFDARMSADPNYETVVKLQGLRILVILPTFQDLKYRECADIVMFLHKGLGDVESNRFGGRVKSFETQRLNVYELLSASCGNGEMMVPFEAMGGCCNECQFPFYCDRCHTFSGMRIHEPCGCRNKCGCDMITNQGIKINPVHLPNCENEAHNQKFIHRK